MPLVENAEKLIRKNLKKVRHGRKPALVEIGTLTEKQLSDLNEHRTRRNLQPMNNVLLFHGRHIYERRVENDAYTVPDVIEQIRSAMGDDSVICITPKMTVLRSTHPRDDRYGNVVFDEIVLECTGRHPNSELYSVVPKGDKIKPQKAIRDRSEATPYLDTQ